MKNFDTLEQINEWLVRNDIQLFPMWESDEASPDSTPDYYNLGYFNQRIPLYRFDTPFDAYDWLTLNPYAFNRHLVAIIFALMRRFESTGELNFTDDGTSPPAPLD